MVGTVTANKAQDVRRDRQGDAAQLHQAHGVRGGTQLEVAFGPPLQQQQHEIKQQQARVGTDAAEGKAASELAVRPHGAHAGGTDRGARNTERDVARGNSGEGGKEGE